MMPGDFDIHQRGPLILHVGMIATKRQVLPTGTLPVRRFLPDLGGPIIAPPDFLPEDRACSLIAVSDKR